MSSTRPQLVPKVRVSASLDDWVEQVHETAKEAKEKQERRRSKSIVMAHLYGHGQSSSVPPPLLDLTELSTAEKSTAVCGITGDQPSATISSVDAGYYDDSPESHMNTIDQTTEASDDNDSDSLWDDRSDDGTDTDSGKSVLDDKTSTGTTADVERLSSLSLFQLARDGDARRMRQKMERLDADECLTLITEQDEKQLTPLHYAARYHHMPVVQLLIERGANANAVGHNKSTPLHHAARYRKTALRRASLLPNARLRDMENTEKVGNGIHHHLHPADTIDEGTGYDTTLPATGSSDKTSHPNQATHAREGIIAYLVKNGAAVNARDSFGMTPLHHAAMRGNHTVARDLIKCGCAIEARDRQDKTPLHVACAYGSYEVTQVLLRHGANPLAEDANKKRAMHIAARGGHKPVVRLLFHVIRAKLGLQAAQDALHDVDSVRYTPLFLAVNHGRDEVVKFLLKKGSDANSQCARNNSPLHDAAAQGKLPIVRSLLKHGACIDATNVQRQTPLHLAAQHGHAQVVAELLERGANIDATDQNGWTTLMYAVSGSRDAAVKLIEGGANVNAVDKLGRTALYIAVEGEYRDTIELLLEEGVARHLVNKSDNHFKTPMHVAAEKGCFEITQTLLAANANLFAKDRRERTPLHLSALCGRTAIVRRLIAAAKALTDIGTKVIAEVDDNGDTPLHYAAAEGNHMVVKELILAGAHIEARNSEGHTPLDCAAIAGRDQEAKVLLEEGASYVSVDKNRRSALHLASEAGHAAVVRLLLARGADSALRDKDGLNCLDLAAKNNHRDAALAIVDKDLNPRWMETLRNVTYEYPENGQKAARCTPFRRLIQSQPEVAEQVLDNCTEALTTTEMVDNSEQCFVDRCICYNYEFIDDSYTVLAPYPKDGESGTGGAETRNAAAPAAAIKRESLSIYDANDKLNKNARPYSTNPDTVIRNHPLQMMVNYERGNLLGHPLVISLLQHKWNAYGRYVYFSVLAVYLIFLALLTTFIVYTPAPYNVNDTDLTAVLHEGGACPSVRHRREAWLNACVIAIRIIAAIQIIMEFYQLWQRRWEYISVKNLVDWIVFMSSLFFLQDFSDCSAVTGLRLNWQWKLGAICIFLAWINLVLMIQKLPGFGIYVVMFADIISTFIRSFLLYVLFIMAFALGFFAMFQNRVSFRTLPSALLKSTVMMIGELEFDGLFNNEDSDHDDTIYYGVFAYILYYLFLMVMTILLMNLLTGLAVGDIQAVQEKANLTRLEMQVELVLHVERALPDRIKRYCMLGRQRIYPERRHRFPRGKMLFKASDHFSMSSDAREIDPEKSPETQLRLNQETLIRDQRVLSDRLTELASQQRRIFSMMNAIRTNMKVDWQDQDDF